jgi:hypothetical protein
MARDCGADVDIAATLIAFEEAGAARIACASRAVVAAIPEYSPTQKVTAVLPAAVAVIVSAPPLAFCTYQICAVGEQLVAIVAAVPYHVLPSVSESVAGVAPAHATATTTKLPAVRVIPVDTDACPFQPAVAP